MPNSNREFDAVIVGAGLAGIYMLHRLRGLGLSARVYEGGAGVGGTWYWNRYPGARCDVESMDYSYSFSEELQQQWSWSERYAAQPEILRYLEHVANRFDLRREIHFATRVVGCAFDEERAQWTVSTDRGDRATCDFLIMATGALSIGHLPAIPGLETFRGDIVHTSHWPATGVDCDGKRVAVIGTGASGVQCVPLLA